MGEIGSGIFGLRGGSAAKSVIAARKVRIRAAVGIIVKKGREGILSMAFLL